jgi:outer membrane protein OmpA-like peptidoglycan-associated protein
MPLQPGGQTGLEKAHEPSPEAKGESEIIKGSVRDSESGLPLSGRVEVTSRLPGGSLKRTSTEFSSGFFEIEVPRKGETDIIVSAEGYTFQTITLPNEKAIDDLSLQPIELELTRVEKGGKLSIESIYFKTGSANIEPASIPVLQQLYQMMTENPEIRIEIEGHTDSTGTSVFNMKLSQQRAMAVADWLIRNGISSTRITTHGYGDTRPVADNSTEEGRRKNRRTEILIIEGK